MSGSKGGGAIIGPENALGMSPVVGVGGRTTTNEQTVVKCKVCDINLGQKDIRYSQEEIDRAEAQEEVRTKKREKNVGLLLFAGLIVVGLGLLIIVGGWILSIVL